jgi:hypothetical protein
MSAFCSYVIDYLHKKFRQFSLIYISTICTEIFLSRGRVLQPLHIKIPRSKYRNIRREYSLCAVIPPTELRTVVKCMIFDFSVPSGKPQVNSGLLPLKFFLTQLK